MRRCFEADAQGPHVRRDRGDGPEGPPVRHGAVRHRHHGPGRPGAAGAPRHRDGGGIQRHESGVYRDADADGGAGDAPLRLGAGRQLPTADPAPGAGGNPAADGASGQPRQRVPDESRQQLPGAEGHAEPGQGGHAPHHRCGGARPEPPPAGGVAGPVKPNETAAEQRSAAAFLPGTAGLTAPAGDDTIGPISKRGGMSVLCARPTTGLKRRRHPTVWCCPAPLESPT